MSSSMNVYLGVYVVVDQYVESERSKLMCENDHPHRYSSHGNPKFCNECGTPVTKHKYMVKERMSWYDAVEEFFEDHDEISDDTFINVDRGDDPCIWITNHSSLYLDEDAMDIAINADYISEALTKFINEYREALDTLEKNNVDFVIRFGAVSFIN